MVRVNSSAIAGIEQMVAGKYAVTVSMEIVNGSLIFSAHKINGDNWSFISVLWYCGSALFEQVKPQRFGQYLK